MNLKILLVDFSANTYHEQIQIQDGSTGNSYEKIFARFIDTTLTQITVQDPYIRAHHQVRFIERNQHLN